MKYKYRHANPDCDCGHAFYSHGTGTFNISLGIMASSMIWMFLPFPNAIWLIFPTMIFAFGLLIIPWRKVCLICKCPKFVLVDKTFKRSI